MPKPDVMRSRRPTTPWRTASFKEFEGSDEIFEFRLRALDYLESSRAAGFAEELISRYITGGYKDVAGDWREKPEIFGFIEDEDGQTYAIEVDRDVCHLIASLEAMQGVKRSVNDDAPRPDVFIAPELVMIAKNYPSVWFQLREFRSKVAGDIQKKAPLKSAGESSEAHSTAETGTPA